MKSNERGYVTEVRRVPYVEDDGTRKVEFWYRTHTVIMPIGVEQNPCWVSTFNNLHFYVNEFNTIKKMAHKQSMIFFKSDYPGVLPIVIDEHIKKLKEHANG